MPSEIEKHAKWIVFGTKDHFQGHVPCSIMAIEPVSGILFFRIRPDPEQHPAYDLVVMDRTDHGIPAVDRGVPAVAQNKQGIVRHLIRECNVAFSQGFVHRIRFIEHLAVD